MRIGVMAALLALLGATRSGEQEGACARASWNCVAQCIDRRCADECLRGACEEQLSKLRQCPASQGCDAGDGACGASRCEDQCTAAFGVQAAAPPLEPEDPGAGVRGGGVPRELVGTWELRAASVEPFQRPGADPAPQPRPDYAKTLRIAPSGCYVVAFVLGAPTLGEGNG